MDISVFLKKYGLSSNIKISHLMGKSKKSKSDLVRHFKPNLTSCDFDVPTLLVSATLGTVDLLLLPPGLSGLRPLSFLEDFRLSIISSFSCLAWITARCCLCCLGLNTFKCINCKLLFFASYWVPQNKYCHHGFSRGMSELSIFGPSQFLMS